MKIKLNTLEDSADVKRILSEHLSIGTSTLAGVQAFLHAQGLDCSPVEHYRGNPEELNAIFRELFTRDFDSYIGCRATAARTRWVRTGIWPWQWVKSWLAAKLMVWIFMMHFAFKDDRLVEIVVVKDGIGF